MTDNFDASVFSTVEKHIAIVGAGPAGLLLARLLQQKQREDGKSQERFIVIIYERDESATSRTQCGSLDLNVNAGQRALETAGVYKEFLTHVQTGGDALTIKDEHNKVHFLIAETERVQSLNETIYATFSLTRCAQELSSKWGAP